MPFEKILVLLKMGVKARCLDWAEYKGAVLSISTQHKDPIFILDCNNCNNGKTARSGMIMGYSFSGHEILKAKWEVVK